MTAANVTPGLSVEFDQPCLGCGYNLRGLGLAGRCPECGKPVEDSLKGNLLRYSNPEYVGLLHRGVVLVQTAIIGQFVFLLGGLLVGIAISTLSPSRTSSGLIEALLNVVSSAFTVVSVIGWWWLSAPDPAYEGTNAGSRARKVVRVTVAMHAGASVLAASLGNVNPSAVLRGGGSALDALASLATLVSIVAWIVWFFAAMKYLQWLAPRLPNAAVLQRAARLMWVGPLLQILCGIGPLIAFVLYYNLLDWMRKDFRGIRDSIAAAQVR